MSKAWLVPGSPTRNVKSGRRSRSSKSIAAFSISGWSWTAALSRPKWVEASTSDPCAASCSRAAKARAVPSCGSVPLPISSRQHQRAGAGRHPGTRPGAACAPRRSSATAAIDWSSPRSTSSRVDQRQRGVLARGHVPAALGQQAEHADGLERDRLAAGVGAADDQHAAARRNLQVQRHDQIRVRPPGRRRPGPPSAADADRRGWRTARPEPRRGRRPRTARLHSRPARISSTSSINAAASRSAGAARSTARFNSNRMRASSAAISSRSEVNSLASRTTPAGSTNSVAPVCERSCTMPSMRRLSPERSGRQKRSPRSVTSSAVGPAGRARAAHRLAHLVAHGALLLRGLPAQRAQSAGWPRRAGGRRVPAHAAAPRANHPAARWPGRRLGPARAGGATLQQVVAQRVQVTGDRGHVHQVGPFQTHRRRLVHQCQQRGRIGQRRPAAVPVGAQFVGQFVHGVSGRDRPAVGERARRRRPGGHGSGRRSGRRPGPIPAGPAVRGHHGPALGLGGIAVQKAESCGGQTGASGIMPPVAVAGRFCRTPRVRGGRSLARGGVLGGAGGHDAGPDLLDAPAGELRAWI